MAATAVGDEAPRSAGDERSQPPRWHRWHVPALAGYAVLTAVFTWPVLRLAGSHLFSDRSDGASFVWSYWDLPHRAFGGHDPFATPDMFWPVGVHTAVTTNTPLESLLAGPLSHLIGLRLTTFVLVLAPVFLSGLAAYLLALHVCGHRWPAFVAGAAFMWCPFRAWRLLGHHNLDHIELLAFGLLAVLLLYDDPARWWRAPALGLVVGLTVLTDYTLATFLVLAVVVVALCRWRATFTRTVVVRLTQAAGVAAVVSAPLLVFVLRDVHEGEVARLPGWGGADVLSADLLSWISPPAVHPWWGSHFTRLSAGESTVYPGIAILVLGIVGAVIVRHHRRIWVSLALVFGVLALGPAFHFNGATGHRFTYLGAHFTVPAPYFVVHFIPVLNAARVPGRFGVVAALALAVLTALAIVHLTVGRPRAMAVLSLVVLGVTLVDLAPPWHRDVLPAAIPAAYDVIARDHTGRAVLEVPLQWRDGFQGLGDGLGPLSTAPGHVFRDDAAFFYYATKHHHPLVNGMVARLPDHRWRALIAEPVYYQVLSMQHDVDPQPATFGVDDLRRLGIGWVVIHRDRPFPDVDAYVNRLGLPVAADDGTTVVYAVP